MKKKIIINGKEYESITKASNELGISRDTISALRKKSNGLIKIPRSKIAIRQNILKPGSIQYMKVIAEENNLFKPEDWYGYYRETNLPSQFLFYVRKNWGGDWIKFLEDLYPNEAIEFWQLKKVSLSIWGSSRRTRQYLEWLALKLKYETLDDFYFLTTKDLLGNFGDGLYKKYKNIFAILTFAFPEHDFKPWKFLKSHSSIWDQRNLHRRFLEDLFKKLGYKSHQDYYKISVKDIHREGARSMLKQYPTLMDCVMSNFPEYKFLPWKFKNTGRKYWENKSNQKHFFEWLIKKLKIKKKEDYYALGERHVIEHGGSGLLIYYDSSVANALISLFPELNLEKPEFDKTSKTQLNLYRFLKYRNPNLNIKYNFKHPKFKFSSSKMRMEIDLYFPEYKFGIEVQGEQHFRSAWGGNKQLQEIQKRDKEKRNVFKKNNLKVYELTQKEIPMEWDKLEAYLKEHISTHSQYLIEKI